MILQQLLLILIKIFSMNDLFTFALLALTSFFTLINPLGSMPIFMSMTSQLTDEERNKTAKKASIVALFTIIAFAFTGQFLFKFFGISVDSLRVVGGVIFFIMGMDMLQARIGRDKIKETEVKSYITDISITPLAIPMICGPGAITNAIVLMEDANSLAKTIILVVSILVIMLITYLILYSSSKLIKMLGETGINVMMRIMGLIVMVIAVEFFFSGLRPIVLSILNSVN
jgi:multiple antibiotic resistance protein